MRGFTTERTTDITGCTARQLRYWDRINFIQPEIQQTGGRAGVRRIYSFHNLVELSTTKSLLDGGISLQKLRYFVSFLHQYAQLNQWLTELRQFTSSRSRFSVVRRADEFKAALQQGQALYLDALNNAASSTTVIDIRFVADYEHFERAMAQAKQRSQLTG